MIHAYFHTICYMFCLHLIAFLCIFRTNILTRCHSASSCFLLFSRFRKVLKELFSELDGTKSSSLRIQRATRSPKETTRRAVGRTHPRVARVPPLARHHVVWGSRDPSDAALSPIYTPRRFNPKTIRHIRQKHPSRHRRQVSGVKSSCSGTLPERGLTPGAISIDSTASTSTP